MSFQSKIGTVEIAKKKICGKKISNEEIMFCFFFYYFLFYDTSRQQIVHILEDMKHSLKQMKKKRKTHRKAEITQIEML